LEDGDFDEAKGGVTKGRLQGLATGNSL